MKKEYNKKACVATYCVWSSYGSIMQSLGLKNALSSIGVGSQIVQIMPKPTQKREGKFAFSRKPKTMLLNIYKFLVRKKIDKRYEKCMDFISNNVDVEYYDKYETIEKNPPSADCYISGSDQVWYPQIWNKSFFLDFVPADKKRFSYAASMGKTTIEKETEDEFSKLISQFDEVSVREDEMVDILKKYTNKEISVHIDPTFLVESDKWRAYQSPYKIKKPYIFVYALWWDKKFNKELKKLHKKTGYDIVNLASDYSPAWSNKKIIDAGPDQFLWLIDNAEAVVTSSFHGVAFSLIFNKRLSAIINPKAPSRIENILNKLKIKNAEIADLMDFDLEQYKISNMNIKAEQKRSIDYLKRILEAE